MRAEPAEEEASYGTEQLLVPSAEEERPLGEGARVSSAAAETVAGGVLLLAVGCFVGVAALAATYGGPLMRPHGHGLRMGYSGLAGDTLYCNGASDGYIANQPKWDPVFSSDEDFYNACYHSFRCCSTTGNGNGCYAHDNLGAKCRSCLGGSPPLMVKDPCADFIDKCDGKTEGCGVAEGDEYTKHDLMSDNGVPKSTKPEFAVVFNNIDSCWNQFGTRDRRSRNYAEKCWEVVSWCHENAKVCPRDAQTVGHVLCKHCLLFGFTESQAALA